MTIPPLMQVRTFAPKTAVVAAGWWEVTGKTCVAAYQPKGAASQAASYSNLANPGTHTLGVTAGTPGWNASTGWDTSSGNNYGIANSILSDRLVWTVATRVNPDTVPQNSAPLLMVGNDYAGWGLFLGPSASSAYVGVLIAAIVWRTSTAELAAGVSAVVAATRDSGGTLTIYVDGSSVMTTTGTPKAPSSVFRIGVDTADGSRVYDGKTLAVALYSDALTAGEIAALSSAMAAL